MDLAPSDRPSPSTPTVLPAVADLVVIGAGIVGLATATAYQRARPDARVVVMDKEAEIAAHQSGHNSGVIHSGLYYSPGSRKAELCGRGRVEMMAFCERHDIAWDRCGKVVVATEADELDRLDALEQRARANGVEVRRLDPSGLAELEPHAAGLAALHVPGTAVVDFRHVCRALADDVVQAGGTVALERPVQSIDRRAGDVLVTVGGAHPGVIRTARVANCAGLASDLVAGLAGDRSDARIIGFRGEYAVVVPERADLVRALIYPVPDPRLPFLGVHLTRSIDGTVHAGPNAVLALAREGYRWRDVDLTEVASMAGDRRTWRLARQQWRTGVHEITRSLSKARMTRALQRLVPDLRVDDLRPGGSGVRAQAVDRAGRLLDDFVFAGDDRVVHVLNAPSPAATASLAIGSVVAGLLD